MFFIAFLLVEACLLKVIIQDLVKKIKDFKPIAAILFLWWVPEERVKWKQDNSTLAARMRGLQRIHRKMELKYRFILVPKKLIHLFLINNAHFPRTFWRSFILNLPKSPCCWQEVVTTIGSRKCKTFIHVRPWCQSYQMDFVQPILSSSEVTCNLPIGDSKHLLSLLPFPLPPFPKECPSLFFFSLLSLMKQSFTFPPTNRFFIQSST